MSGGAARTVDPEFPNLAPEVVEGYRNAPAHLVAEVIDGGLSLMPRPGGGTCGQQVSCTASSMVPSIGGATALAAGCSCRSRSCTSGRGQTS